MSWTSVSQPYATFRHKALGYSTPVLEPQQYIEIWELDEVTKAMRRRPETNSIYLDTKASLRVIFAPLDLPQAQSLQQLLELFQVLSVPREFTIERVQDVAHSFGTRIETDGTSTWFHFLCKRIELLSESSNVDPKLSGTTLVGESALLQAKYGWHRSGFFLRTTHDGRTTLAIFGATPNVYSRIVDFLQTNHVHVVQSEPLVLLDLILEGLFLDVDTALWNMVDVFGPMEHDVLNLANSKNVVNISKNIDFAKLHDCAKHNNYIAEAVDSMLLLVDRMLVLVKRDAQDTDTARETLQRQLADSLEYRRSLFKSTKLRQTSLQRRIDIAITLSFNLVTQQDSMVMIRDSNSMKIIAAITMIFLPTSAVAAVLGSQLFMSQINEDGLWTVQVTPPFNWLWWISVPLTIVIAIFAYVRRCCTRARSSRPAGNTYVLKGRMSQLQQRG
ncbi:hypothetical protein TruAng_005650 [Truncatella angustata]|nr:hypothetical protein TruAng_005650 [Truncatella angustata]